MEEERKIKTQKLKSITNEAWYTHASNTSRDIHTSKPRAAVCTGTNEARDRQSAQRKKRKKLHIKSAHAFCTVALTSLATLLPRSTAATFTSRIVKRTDIRINQRDSEFYEQWYRWFLRSSAFMRCELLCISYFVLVYAFGVTLFYTDLFLI